MSTTHHTKCVLWPAGPNRISLPHSTLATSIWCFGVWAIVQNSMRASHFFNLNLHFVPILFSTSVTLRIIENWTTCTTYQSQADPDQSGSPAIDRVAKFLGAPFFFHRFSPLLVCPSVISQRYEAWPMPEIKLVWSVFCTINWNCTHTVFRAIAQNPKHHSNAASMIQ